MPLRPSREQRGRPSLLLQLPNCFRDGPPLPLTGWRDGMDFWRATTILCASKSGSERTRSRICVIDSRGRPCTAVLRFGFGPRALAVCLLAIRGCFVQKLLDTDGTRRRVVRALTVHNRLLKFSNHAFYSGGFLRIFRFVTVTICCHILQLLVWAGVFFKTTTYII